jgi:methylated-DNA-[protein]-cysteine S-methyltransferase
MRFKLVETPIGKCAIVYKEERKKSKVNHIFLPDESIISRLSEMYPNITERGNQQILNLENAILDYFAGMRKRIPMTLLDTSLCYPFQLKVLKTERTIPYGKTASYGWVARQIGTNAYRAVGNALAHNPFPIVIPCHRAVRSDRTLGGFQGGLDMKRKLLELEGIKFDSKGRVIPGFFMK